MPLKFGSIIPKVGQTVQVEERLVATRVNKGWVGLKYTSPSKVTNKFNLRPKQFAEVLGKERGMYETLAENTYSKWIKTTKKGQMFADRRHVEGVLKTANARGDVELADKITKVLEGSDKKVSEFWNEWYDSMSAMQIDEFFNYEPTGSDASGLREGEYDD